jgi:hypothetical protein
MSSVDNTKVYTPNVLRKVVKRKKDNDNSFGFDNLTISNDVPTLVEIDDNDDVVKVLKRIRTQ